MGEQILKTYFILLAILGVAACGQKDVVNSIEYYQAHVKEAAEQLKICEAVGTTQNQQTNCQNATQALMRNSVKDSASKPFKGSGL